MPKNIVQLTLLISGTIETEAEQSAIETVVGEINKKLEKTHSVQLITKSWPRDFRPGVNTDPQQEINRQLKDGVDLYIGLLGTRFGSATPRAGSGTEEEFNNALKRFRDDTCAIRVLFYFKSANSNVFTIEHEQFEKVKEFRKKLSPSGVLYKDFKDISEFIKIIEEDLYNLIVDEWDTSTKTWKSIELPKNPEYDLSKQEVLGAEEIQGIRESLENSPEELEDEADVGIFDIYDEMQTTTDTLTESLNNITKYTKDIGDRMTQIHSQNLAITLARIGTLGTTGQQIDTKVIISKAKETLNLFATDLEQYAINMTPEVRNFKQIVFKFLNLYRDYKIYLEEQKDNEKETNQIMDAIEIIIDSMENTKNSMSNLQEELVKIPSLTGKLRRARTKCANIVGQFVAELAFAIDHAKEIYNEYENIKKSDS